MPSQERIVDFNVFREMKWIVTLVFAERQITSRLVDFPRPATFGFHERGFFS